MTVVRSPILFTVEQIAGKKKKKNTRVLCKYLTTGNNRAEIWFITWIPREGYAMRYARNVINTDFRSCEKCDLILEQFIFTREIFQSSFPFFFPLESLKYRRVYLVARKQREITIRQNINARGKKYLYDASTRFSSTTRKWRWKGRKIFGRKFKPE